MPQIDSKERKSVVLGVTGASGAVFARRFLQFLERDSRIGKIHLVISESGLRVARHELGIEATDPAQVADFLACGKTQKTIYLPETDIGASIASGSYRVDWMAVVPCSMGTVAKIANGLSTSLLGRAADVTLKEHRPLLLAVRDTPFGQIHLENLLRIHHAGGTIFPIIPSFYNHPTSIDALVTQYCCRALGHLGLPQDAQFEWQG